ncbi:MAG: tRNA pseudouridine(38-40) synthase TruA [Gammaproteobacteria bacterium]|nr:tRNA pseudouridine(38-40) synthase TruA [Gammaproteobacteria bacterium]MYF38767.1 tRNA pseudouridine(38-40) synthase TruA [Gammaproteobacteria bacterium]
MKHHLALGIEYVGSKFSGTQTQNEQRTVQLELERAVSQVAAEPVSIRLSSRTDCGVHATSQVVAFQTNSFRDIHNWRDGVNTYLPEDIAVHTVISVDQNFDARRSSRWRRYLYIWGESEHTPAIGKNLAAWVSSGLQIERMDFQAQLLLGEHDFSSFRGAHCQSNSPHRCVHAISVFRASDYVVFDIVANAFLLRMVRNIAGALLDIGRGSDLDLSTLLAYRNRIYAPATAPATGLYLVQISYQDYPELSRLRVPRILGSNVNILQWESDDFVNVREFIEPHNSLAE